MQNRASESEKLPKINPRAIRDLTNSSSCSKLEARLYKNSSLSRINPNLSMLGPSIEESQLNKSNSNSLLIASISLKKLKKSSENLRMLEFSNGKILLNDHSTLEKKSPQGRKLFKKLDKINNSTNKILPDVTLH